MPSLPSNPARLDGIWWLGPDARFHRGSIRLRAGRIQSLRAAETRAAPPPGVPFLVPGLVDAHVHLREPGQTRKEGIANGTAAALAGGVTLLLDMPNNVPPVTTPARLDAKRARFAARSRANYALFLQADPARPPAPFPRRAAALKIYMSPASAAPPVRDPAVLAALFRAAPRVTLHAEDDRAFRADPSLPHHLRRPRRAIDRALRAVETAWRSLPPADRPRLVLAHVSTAGELRWAARMRRLGCDLRLETCPHYLLFTQRDALAAGPLLQVNPPLRTPADRAALRRALLSGAIDFVSTDHAPHLPAEKAGAAPPSGLAGIEWLGPLLLTLALRGLLPWRRYLSLTAAAPAAAYSLPPGRVPAIAPGHPADFLLVEPLPDPAPPAGLRREPAAKFAKVRQKWPEFAKPWQNSGTPPRKICQGLAKNARICQTLAKSGFPAKTATRASFNPYAGFPFACRIEAVYLAGRLAARRGRPVGPPTGKEITPR